jgi:hypothetical protein
MAGLSRRTFLQSSAAAAAGAAVIGVPISSALAAGSTKSAPASAAGTAGAVGSQASGPLVVWVSDASAGDLSILVGENEVTYHDPDLVARLARAARNS